MPAARTTEQIRSELGTQRVELTDAVEHLRGEIGGTLKKKLPVAAVAALAIGLVLAGGLRATKRYFARRRD
jgi:hypothetical protein